MSRLVVLIFALVGLAHSDDSAYTASAAGYGAPAESYGTPSEGYGAPEYSPSAYGPTGVSGGGDLFDLGKLEELLPLFIAVFAAIILAQVLAPLLGTVFNLKVGLLGPLIAPLRDTKAGFINAFLNPFGLQLCDLNLNAVGRENTDAAWSATPELLDLLSGAVNRAFENHQ